MWYLSAIRISEGRYSAISFSGDQIPVTVIPHYPEGRGGKAFTSKTPLHRTPVLLSKESDAVSTSAPRFRYAAVCPALAGSAARSRTLWLREPYSFIARIRASTGRREGAGRDP